MRPDFELVAERGTDLLAALEARQAGGRRHADATASWALAIAVELRLAHERALAVRETARLHEIGKLYLPQALLAQPQEELAAAERRRLDEQAAAAAKLAGGAGLPPAPCGWLEHWRERFDGHGPAGLYGGAIPIESRIIRAACAFELALGLARQRGGGHDDALADLLVKGGNELDPEAVSALQTTLRRAAR